MSTTDRVILEIRPAKDSEETPEAMIQFLAGLTGSLKSHWWMELWRTQPTITLEMAALRQTVYFIITADARLELMIRSLITAQYRTAMITKMDDYLPAWSKFGSRFAQQLVLKAPSYLPFKTYNKFTSTDPLTGILGVLSKTPRDTAVIVQIVLSKAHSGWTSAGRTLIKQGVSSDPTKHEAHPLKAIIEEKISAPAFWSGIRILGVAQTDDVAQNLVGQLAGAFGTYAMTEGNGLVGGKNASQYELIRAIRERSMAMVPRGQYLNLIELASLYHLPGLSMSALKNIAWGKSIKGEPPDNLPVEDEMTEEEKKETTFFARTEFKNKMSNFGIKLKDRRRHFYVLGKSGTGKSTLIANMVAADIANGRGVGVIDPHGDLCDILLDYIPQDRIHDVVYLDPSDVNNPFRLNPLEVRKPEHKELIASGIVAIFAKLYANSWGPRLEYILRNTLMTLVEIPGSTMIDVINILTNDDFRHSVVSKLPRDNIVLVNFWEKEYNEYPDKLKTEAIAPILNKVGQFIGSPIIRRIIASPVSTINLEDLMNDGKILLLNLSQGKLGEDNATLLGAMFITQFQQAAMNRVYIAEEDRRDFFLYVDEFQNFATTSFIKILSEARKYRLGLVLANQYTAQLPPEIQDAIFGNIGSVATFVVGADDADRIAKELGNIYTMDDLVSLDKHQIVTKVTVDNRISGAFPAYTLPMPPNKTPYREEVIRLSQELYQSKIVDFATPSLMEQFAANPTATPPRPVRDGGGKRYDDRRGGGQGGGGNRGGYQGGGQGGGNRNFQGGGNRGGYQGSGGGYQGQGGGGRDFGSRQDAPRRDYQPRQQEPRNENVQPQQERPVESKPVVEIKPSESAAPRIENKMMDADQAIQRQFAAAAQKAPTFHDLAEDKPVEISLTGKQVGQRPMDTVSQRREDDRSRLMENRREVRQDRPHTPDTVRPRPQVDRPVDQNRDNHRRPPVNRNKTHKPFEKLLLDLPMAQTFDEPVKNVAQTPTKTPEEDKKDLSYKDIFG